MKNITFSADKTLVRQALEDREGCINYTNVRETVNVLSRKLDAAPH